MATKKISKTAPAAFVKPLARPRGAEVTSLQQMLTLGLPPELATPLWQALRRARTNESRTEAQFVGWLISHASQYARLDMIDTAGNVWFKIPLPNGEDSETLFIAHTDTVHYQGGPNAFEVLDDTLQAGMLSDCLGADNGAGLSLLVYLMAHQVPGTYVYSRGEEQGGIGAKYIADTYPRLLGKYKRAITFDRRGTADVISHQGGSRCCSDVFAWALTDALNDRGMLYAPSDKGVYTDTREFVGDISECTNISTGYYQEHGPSEHLDLGHYRALAAAIVTIDWEALPTERNPAEKAVAKGYSSYAPTSYDTGSGWDDDDSLYDEIREAQAGDTAGLKARLAEELYPEDPIMASRFISMKRIKVSDYEKAAEMFSDTAVQFLLDIVNTSEPVQ